MLNKKIKKILLNIAKKSVEAYVREGRVLDWQIKEEELNKKQGAFVTLYIDKKLRGCIGQIEPSEKSLWQVVRDMAIAAATEDPRFNPVSEGELEKIDYEISILSVPKKIDNWHEIKLGKHGVIIKKGWQSGVFLPQVADETGWDLEEFLANLCAHKAGLMPGAYKNDPDIDIRVFEAEVFS